MLFIFGIRIATLGRFIDRDHICYRCQSFDREVLVSRPYFHFCLIPVFPTGQKQFDMHCRKCGDDTRLDSVVEQYEGKIRSSLYLYSAWILVAGFVLFWFYWNKNNQQFKASVVANPQIGDVFTIRKENDGETTYYFLRIAKINEDTLFVLHDNLDYGGFVSSLAHDDYFVRDDTMQMMRKKLKNMLRDDEIYSVDRDYGDGSGFNRIR
jgi:hypothetical protein